jgi:3-ketosteroid 9alpha-monooxygenase subunit A
MMYRDNTSSFARGWYCIAESADVSANMMIPVTYLGQQLIVYRDGSGAARAADAYCPHLGAHLASHDGCLTEGQIVCPFHKWRFDAASGKCTSIPYTNIVPPQAKLTLYPVREIAGMVLMWWHPEGVAPDFEPYDPSGVTEPDSGWLRAGDYNRVSFAPFRDLFENLFDTAHVQQLHNSTVMPSIEKVTRIDYGLRVDYGTTLDSPMPVTSMTGHFSGLGLMTQIIEGESFGMIQMATATPIDLEKFHLHVRIYMRDTGSPEMNEMMREATVSRTLVEIGQDAAVLDFKKHLKRPLICAGDGPIMKYRTYADEFFA